MPGQNIGYMRVSTIIQNTERQLYGVQLDKVFEDKLSGKDTKRPQLQACLEYCRQGDALHCHSIDRLARNLFDLLNLIHKLLNKGVSIHFHKENMTFSPDKENPTQTLYLNILGSVAQFERSLINERIREGVALARQRNAYKNVGRKKLLTAEQISEIRSKKEQGVPVSKLSKEYSVSRQTIYQSLKPAVTK